MPIYEYECGFCGNIKEEYFMSYEEAESYVVRCPECNWEMRRAYITPPRKALLDRATMRKHSYPNEHGLDSAPRRRIIRPAGDG